MSPGWGAHLIFQAQRKLLLAQEESAPELEDALLQPPQGSRVVI